MDSVPFAHEAHGDAFGDHGGAVALDRDIVLKIADAPRFRLGGADEGAGKQRE